MRFLVGLVALCMVQTANAVPTELQHQGRLMDNNGVPFTGSHTLTFRLYDSPSSTSPLWEETTTVDFDSGYYALQLGTDTTNPLDDSLFEAGALFVGLAVDGGAELPDRLPVSSTPFARRAGVSLAVDGGLVNASELQINGLTIIDGAGTFLGVLTEQTLSGLGCIADQMPRFDGSTWACVDGGITALSCAAGQIAAYDGFDWSCSSGVDTLSSLSCSAGDLVTFDGATWSCSAPSQAGVDSWTNLLDIPSSIDSIANLSCADAQTLSWSDTSGAWTCGDPIDTTLSQGTVISYVTDSPIDLADGSTVNGVAIGTDTLASLPCVDGEVAQLVGGVWSCASASAADTLNGLACGDGAIIVYDSGLGSWQCDALALTDSDTLADLQCTGDGDYAAWDSTTSTWTCTTLAISDSDTLADLGLTCASGAIPTWQGSYWTCSDDTLASLTCTVDEVPLWDGIEWTCAPASSATITWGDITGIPAALDDIATGTLAEAALPYTGLNEVSGGALDNEFAYVYGVNTPTTINDGQENNPTSSQTLIPAIGPSLSLDVTVHTTGNSDHEHVQYIARHEYNGQLVDYTVVAYGDYTGTSAPTDVWSVTKRITSFGSTSALQVFPEGTWTLIASDNEDLAGNPTPGVDGSFTWQIDVVAVTPDKASVNGDLVVDGDLVVNGELIYQNLQTFTNATLENNWVDYGNTYAPASYSKTGSGMVHLRGLVKDGDTCVGNGQP